MERISIMKVIFVLFDLSAFMSLIFSCFLEANILLSIMETNQEY